MPEGRLEGSLDLKEKADTRVKDIKEIHIAEAK